MTDADTLTSLAASTLARARWKATRPDRLIRELSARSDELGPEQIARLEALVGAKDTTAEESV